MKKILLMLFLMANLLFAKNIEYKNFPEKIKIHNLNNKKYYSYFLLKSQEKLNFVLDKTSEARIYSRILNPEFKNYSYELKLDGNTEIIRNSEKKSKVSVAPTRDFTSTISKVERNIIAKHDNYIKNLNSFPIIVKIKASELKVKKNETEYRKITPTEFSKKMTLVVKNQGFSYFSAENKDIVLSISGPKKIKIISRMIFDDSLQNRVSYSFDIFKNGKLEKKINKRAFKSEASYLEDSKKSIPSHGGISYIEVPEGFHTIRISEKFKNRKLIFNILEKEL